MQHEDELAGTTGSTDRRGPREVKPFQFMGEKVKTHGVTQDMRPMVEKISNLTAPLMPPDGETILTETQETEAEENQASEVDPNQLSLDDISPAAPVDGGTPKAPIKD